jgi:hypothetical protein
MHSNSAVYKYGLWIALASIPIAVSSIALALSYLRIADHEEYEELLKEFSRFIREAYELEKRGRELASREDDIVDDEIKWLEDLKKLYKDIGSKARELFSKLHEIGAPTDVVESLRQAWAIAVLFSDSYYGLLNVFNKARYVARRGDSIGRHLSDDDVNWAEFYIKYLDDSSLERLGRRCTWIVVKLAPARNASFSAVINDITACHHLFTDWLAINFDPELKKVIDKVYEKGGRRELVDMCVEWAKTEKAIEKADALLYTDYISLRCIVIGNKAYVRVGSAAGHATHVEVTDDKLRIEYYDRDEDVHRALMELAKRLGIDVVSHRASEVTLFRAPIGKATTAVATLLAFSTSMDERLGRGENYWTARLFTRSEFRDIYEKCNRDPICTEVELIMKTISENRLAKYI